MLFPVLQLGKLIRVSGHSFDSSCKRIKMERSALKIDNIVLLRNFQVSILITD